MSQQKQLMNKKVQNTFTYMYSLNMWLSLYSARDISLKFHSLNKTQLKLIASNFTSSSSFFFFCTLNRKKSKALWVKKSESGRLENYLPLICANNWLLNPGDWEHGKIKSRISADLTGGAEVKKLLYFVLVYLFLHSVVAFLQPLLSLSFLSSLPWLPEQAEITLNWSELDGNTL